MNHFTTFNDSPLLDEEMSRRVIRYAKKKMTKSEIRQSMTKEAVASMEKVFHSQVNLGELLGEGGFSAVFEVKGIQSKRKHDPTKLAVKVLQPHLIESPPTLATCAADLYKEGVLMASLHHDNILNAQAWAHNGISGFDTNRHDAFFLILERLDITLEDRLNQQRKNQTGFLRKRSAHRTDLDAILQLASAIKYLHSRSVLHRDLKPANIGFDGQGVLKVFDFDVSRVLPKSTNPDEVFRLTNRTGSPRYMAPEVALGGEYNLKADVYSFALLAHEIMTLQKPYQKVSVSKFNKVVHVEGKRPRIPSVWPKAIVCLLESCWAETIEERPTMDVAHDVLREELPNMSSAETRPLFQRATSSWMSFKRHTSQSPVVVNT